MDRAKIRLSPEEIDLITRADWILTKNRIMEKARHLLAGLQEDQTALLQLEKLGNEVKATTPKISKGENYHGLPYLILDHPRVFEKNDVFAIRTFFWWGHFFSTTLHLSGRYLELYRNRIACAYEQLKEHAYFICVGDSPWEHHFDETNYKLVSDCTAAEFSQRVEEKDFTRLAKKIPLSDWEDAPVKLKEMFSQLLAAIR